ncbi:kinase-like protein [Phlegmacium glaucopus]|nr:kinase-like protein [Phlegmacium glaucopus]
MEYIAFYVLLRCFYEDASRYKTKESSSLKAQGLKRYFIIPPFFSGRKDCDILQYREETHWTFPLFLLCFNTRLPLKYTPVSDVSVWFGQLDLPLIIAEVASKPNEEDRYHMLVQAIALARLIFKPRKPDLPTSTKHPFIVAIYLTKTLHAERYILMKSDVNQVYISKKDFDLTDQDDAVVFQREMYNLASELETLVDQLDVDKRGELDTITKQALAMKSLHSSDAWGKRTNIQTLAYIDEEDDDSELQDDDELGVFNDYNVRAILDQMNYKMSYVAFGRPNIALIVNRTDAEMVRCLKFVKNGGQEIEILQYLADLPSESNHTVRPIRIWPITGGSIIAMPLAGNTLTSLIDLDTHLWPLMTQLFEAVKFMHDHNVAHMDLKPSNILIPSAYGRLTIVDFGVSVRLRNATQLRQGCVGTEGYMAPEVGRTKFSPIRADLWSTGKTVQELCMHCHPSPDREWLLALSNHLLDDDPSKRPMMLEVLQLMLNYKAVEILHGDQTHVS